MLLLLVGLSTLALTSRFDLLPRIAGGEKADYTPWIAILSYGDVLTKFQCGGSVLTERHILTAAHCVSAAYINGKLSSSYMATVGTNVINGSGQNYSIIANYTHPNYRMEYVKNDLGIVVTNASIIFSPLVERVTLNFNHIADGVNVVIYGWGSAGLSEPLNPELEELEIVTVNSTYCLEETKRIAMKYFGFIPPFIDPDKELCAYKEVGSGTCKGDSGSPLVCAATNEQVGITSWGIPCALGAPDMFTRLSNYKEWILKVVDDMGYLDKLKYTMHECTNNKTVY
ncbi:unnamed protein product [Leptosia nina]|uniref:Peptidase S1 domain-containing protein n=1 Tax=Leptosia nina TaxID=320188 RepID=A0AAV1JUJ2_9NEOP